MEALKAIKKRTPLPVKFCANQKQEFTGAQEHLLPIGAQLSSSRRTFVAHGIFLPSAEKTAEAAAAKNVRAEWKTVRVNFV